MDVSLVLISVVSSNAAEDLPGSGSFSISGYSLRSCFSDFSSTERSTVSIIVDQDESEFLTMSSVGTLASARMGRHDSRWTLAPL